MRAATGAWADEQQVIDDGDGYPPSDPEIVENLTEMRSLLQTVGGSICRLEALGSVLRNCVALSPDTAPPGALSLAAAVEEFGQQPSRPSQMSVSADYAWQSPEEPEKSGASHVVPDVRGAAFDGMILDALHQLYPSGAGPTQSHRGAGMDPCGDPASMGQMRLPGMEEQDPPGFQQHDGGAQYQQQYGGQAMQQPQEFGSHFQRPEQPGPRGMYIPPSAPHETPVEQHFVGTSAMGANSDQFLASDVAGGLPSIGSIGHHQDMCKPCVFLYNGVCLKAARCQFCHMAHNPEKVRRVRPSKRTRNLLRQHRDDDDQPAVQSLQELGDPQMFGFFAGVQ